MMLQKVKYFNGLFIELCHKSFPSFWDEDGKLISQSEYQALLIKARLYHRKFKDTTQSLSGKAIIDKLDMDFEIVFSFKSIGSNIPPIYYVYHVELIFLAKEMTNHEVPYGDQWKTIERFGKMKYRLHQ